MKEKEKCPCKFCGTPTVMLETQMCDECWDVEWRIETALARKALDKILAAHGHKLEKLSD